MSVVFKEGSFYTRDQIHDQLGGEKQTYLPSFNNRVVCACLSKDLNPYAPEVVLVGKKDKVEKRAHLLSQQQGPIPVFMKDCSNSWRYAGLYVCNGWFMEQDIIQKESVGSGRENLAGVLYLKKHNDKV